MRSGRGYHLLRDELCRRAALGLAARSALLGAGFIADMTAMPIFGLIVAHFAGRPSRRAV